MSKKVKKIILFFASIIVLLRIGYICIGDELSKHYFVSRKLELSDAVPVPCKDVTVYFSSDRNRLNSIEIFFDGIANDKDGKIILKILSDDNLIYQANISLAGLNNQEWKKIYINAELTKQEYSIYLDASGDCTQIPNILVIPESQAAPEATSSYVGETELDGEIAIQYGFLQPPSWADKCVTSSLWCIFLLIIWMFLEYFERITQFGRQILNVIYIKLDKRIFNVVTELFCCMVIVNCSGIDFQGPTRIILYAISIGVSIGMQEKKQKLSRIFNTPIKRAAIYALYIYAAFSLVGQRIFIYPLLLRVTLAGMFVFLSTVIWCIPVVQTIFYCYECLESKVCSKNHSMNSIVFGGLIILILLMPAIYNLYANNPGISTVDTALTLAQSAHQLHGNTNWHPLFYNAMLAIIIRIWDSTYAVILVQYFFWIYVLLEFLLYLRKKGLRDSILICVALFTGLNAANILHINTIWKDIPYALSLLWVFTLLAKLSIDHEKYQKKWYIYFELLLALVGVYFYRRNGIVPFAVTALMLIVILRKNIKIWCILAMAVISIKVISGPVYSYFEVIDTGYGGMYIGLSQEILGTYYAGGEVSENTLQMINIMTGGDNLEYNYIPTWAYQTYSLNVEPQKFIINYIDTFIKNPILMIRALINREDVIWNIYAGEGTVLGCVNVHGTMDDSDFDWNLYYPRRKYVSLYDSMEAATGYTANSQWIAALEWRCGIFTLLGLAAIIYMAVKRGIKKYILIIAPILGQILSLVLSTGWSDFRYFWPLNLMNMFVLLLPFVLDQPPKTEVGGEHR